VHDGIHCGLRPYRSAETAFKFHYAFLKSHDKIQNLIGEINFSRFRILRLRDNSGNVVDPDHDAWPAVWEAAALSLSFPQSSVVATSMFLGCTRRPQDMMVCVFMAREHWAVCPHQLGANNAL
jgi:hypothetical protein